MYWWILSFHRISVVSKNNVSRPANIIKIRGIRIHWKLQNSSLIKAQEINFTEFARDPYEQHNQRNSNTQLYTIFLSKIAMHRNQKPPTHQRRIHTSPQIPTARRGRPNTTPTHLPTIIRTALGSSLKTDRRAAISRSAGACSRVMKNIHLIYRAYLHLTALSQRSKNEERTERGIYACGYSTGVAVRWMRWTGWGKGRYRGNDFGLTRLGGLILWLRYSARYVVGWKG